MSGKFIVDMYNWQQQVPSMIGRYQTMQQHAPSMFREVKYQYQDMARGGNGGGLGFAPPTDESWQEALVEALQPVEANPSIRNYNYPGVPDEFFQMVLKGLGVSY